MNKVKESISGLRGKEGRKVLKHITSAFKTIQKQDEGRVLRDQEYYQAISPAFSVKGVPCVLVYSIDYYSLPKEAERKPVFTAKTEIVPSATIKKV